jgi:hypothetical protein
MGHHREFHQMAKKKMTLDVPTTDVAPEILSNKPPATRVQITAPNMSIVAIPLVSTAPYVSNRFGPRAHETMRTAQQGGSVTRKGTKREPKDFSVGYRDSLYTLPDGHNGLNAAAFRQAAISACRLVGFKMTYAKLCLFIEADGYDVHDGTPLVRLVGTHEEFIAAVRNANGSADLRSRAMFREWSATVRVRFDADQFTYTDVVNLFMRIGMQVGVGAGRADSRESSGLGFGFFAIGSEVQVGNAAA